MMVMCGALLQPYAILLMRYRVDRWHGGGSETQGAGLTAKSHDGPEGNNIIIILSYNVNLKKRTVHNTGRQWRRTRCVQRR